MRDFSSEILFRTTRSGGKGGQHVNKVETRVEAMWQAEASAFFTPDEKLRIGDKLEKRINREGFLSLTCSETRSQLENKQIAVARMLELVEKALYQPPRRRRTRPSKAVIEKRKEQKRQLSEKKQMRKKDF